jgi:hypothetical protein
VVKPPNHSARPVRARTKVTLARLRVDEGIQLGILWPFEVHCIRRDVCILQPGSRIEEYDAV